MILDADMGNNMVYIYEKNMNEVWTCMGAFTECNDKKGRFNDGIVW